MVLINNLCPRDNIFIKNKFEKISNTIDDFHIVCYYIDINKIKIIVRRLDNDTGWEENIKIKLYDLNSNLFEIISIGSSSRNSKIITYYTNIDLLPIEYVNQKIPKVIFQTTFSKNITDTLHYNSILTFIELNPEYEYILFDDTECRVFIKNNFDLDTLIAYDLLVAGSFKADLFRYCYLYINGGCYFDCKQILRIPLRDIIQPTDEILLCKDIDHAYFNAVMMSIKKNDKIYRTIELCKKKILNFKYHYNINEVNFNHSERLLSLTGPHLLYQALSSDHNIQSSIKFFHHNKHSNHEYQRLLIEYKNELFITKQYKGYLNRNHYQDLWFNRKIVYYNQTQYENYSFYIYPYKNNDTKYNFYILNNNLLLIIKEYNDFENYKFKIINETTNKEYSYELPHNNKCCTLLKTDGFFSENKNIQYLESFKLADTTYSDKFDINIILDHNNLKKMVVKRTDNEGGWGQDLKILFRYIDDSELYNIDIGPSSENYIVKSISEPS